MLRPHLGHSPLHRCPGSVGLRKEGWWGIWRDGEGQNWGCSSLSCNRLKLACLVSALLLLPKFWAVEFRTPSKLNTKYTKEFPVVFPMIPGLATIKDVLLIDSHDLLFRLMFLMHEQRLRSPCTQETNVFGGT